MARDSAEDEWMTDCGTRRWWELVDQRGAPAESNKWVEGGLIASVTQKCLSGTCGTGSRNDKRL